MGPQRRIVKPDGSVEYISDETRTIRRNQERDLRNARLEQGQRRVDLINQNRGLYDRIYAVLSRELTDLEIIQRTTDDERILQRIDNIDLVDMNIVYEITRYVRDDLDLRRVIFD